MLHCMSERESSFTSLDDPVLGSINFHEFRRSDCLHTEGRENPVWDTLVQASEVAQPWRGAD